MKLRHAFLGLLVVALLAPLVSAAAGRSPAPARSSNMLIYAQEWTLYASRPSVPAGRVDVQLWNRGQDAHDVRLRRIKNGEMVGRVLDRLPVTASGQRSNGTWTLGRGHYELYCSLPGHLAMGMHFLLTVTQ